MKELYILGSGGFARETYWIVKRVNEVSPEWIVRGFIEDNSSNIGNTVDDLSVIGNSEYLNAIDHQVWCVSAIGSPTIRKRSVEKIKSPLVGFANIIDPSVKMSNSVTIGEGNIICADSILTVDIKVGNHVIINLDCTIGHDSVISDYVTINPGSNISGNDVIGSEVEIGTGTRIIQGKHIADKAIIGAGAVVSKDLPANCTAVGVPAKPIKFNKKV